MKQIWTAGFLILVGLMMITGCETKSERLARMADRTVEMQSQQNTSMARTNQELAKLNREIQAERNELSRGFSQLEEERRTIQNQQRSELAWSESFRFLAIVIAAVMPLFLCAFLIWAATRSPQKQDLVNEILIQELVAQRPRLVAGPNRPALEDRSRSSSEGDLNCND